MALPQRRTKIVATIGPASSSPEKIRELIAAGMNVARVTLAHGTIESQKALVAALRREADAVASPLAILVDLPGPKVRTTAFIAPIDLATGDVVTLIAGTDEPSSASRFVVDYPTLVEDVDLGDDIAIGDGAVQLRVNEKRGTSLSATVTYGGHLSGCRRGKGLRRG
jgi:pyruvate kinase